MNTVEIVNLIASGKAVLICGAGFSFCSKNNTGKRPPAGDELMDYLLSELRKKEPDDILEDVADEYIEKYKYAKTISTLEKYYRIVGVPDFYHHFLGLNWKRVYTTNYDDLIDIAYAQNGKQTKDVDCNPNEVKNKSGMCLHINGSIRNINSSTLRSHFKLTRKSYLTDSFCNNPWSRMFENDIDSAKLIIIIGYSFNFDLDLNRYLFRTDNIKSKTIIITKPDESSKNIRKLSNYGVSQAKGVELFCKEINDESKKVKEIIDEIDKVNSFSVFKYDDESFDDITDKQEFDLLFYGKYDCKLYNSVKDNYYLIYREKLKAVIDKMSTTQVFAVHSDLGNGKTIFLNMIGKMLSKEYSVFFLKEEKNIDEEVDYIIGNYDNIIFIIDGYLRHKRVVELINERKTDSVHMIISERSFSLKLLIDIPMKVQIIDLNVLSNGEVNGLIKLLDLHPVLWSGIKFREKEDKNDYIKAKCNSSFQHFLINLIKSSNILNKFAEIVNENTTNIVIDIATTNHAAYRTCSSW